MNVKRGVLLLAWAAFAALPCFAENSKGPSSSLSAAQGNPALVSQDPLMQQMRRRQLTQPNGGVTAVVRIASGQVIELKLVDLDIEPVSGPKDGLSPGAAAPNALRGLDPHPGLADREGKNSRKNRPIKRASEQLKVLEDEGTRQDWGEGSHTEAVPRRKGNPSR